MVVITRFAPYVMQSPSFKANPPIWSLKFTTENQRMGETSGAVSYTHLDVYKRQPNRV